MATTTARPGTDGTDGGARGPEGDVMTSPPPADADDGGFPLANPEQMTLEQLQHWTRILGLSQQMVLERIARLQERQADATDDIGEPLRKFAQIQMETASKGMDLWQSFLASRPDASGAAVPARGGDRRFADPRWHEHPVFSLIRQSYFLGAEALMRMVDSMDGVDERQRSQLRFAARNFIDASSPTNFPMLNPAVLEKTIETQGQNLLTGLERMLNDLERGQLSQTDTSNFRLGETLATTPGKVVWETPLYQLIQYSPATGQVFETPLVIFPPWINRFYILDLGPEKSFVKWAVDQGLTVFMVSWKSADETLADVVWDDYVLRGQIDAIDVVRDLLGVASVHTIGYCVAGTTLAATLALLDARGRRDAVKSATFFTAQVDFADAGELGVFIDDQQLKLVEQLVTDGYLDGRFLAATFNLLRANDLIWNYVVNNYLLASDYVPFDLLYWNGDTTNLPAKWLRSYLVDLYRDNRLVQADSLSVDGTPIDIRRVAVPCYIQAGVEDHIAPAPSVWKAMRYFSGPKRFVLAGSGHIAGVVNPPSRPKYQYWTCDEAVETLDRFRALARETKGSWWPDWIAWIESHSPEKIPVAGARVPGGGKLPALEDAPGSYVKRR